MRNVADEHGDLLDYRGKTQRSVPLPVVLFFNALRLHVPRLAQERSSW